MLEGFDGHAHPILVSAHRIRSNTGALAQFAHTPAKRGSITRSIWHKIPKICASWSSTPVSFAGDRRATPITSALHNQGALTLKSVTNSRYRFAPFTISRTTRPAMSGCGGRSTRLTRSWWPHACGKKASSRWRRAAISECRFQTLAQLLAVAVIAGFCESAAANQISLDPEEWDIRFSYDMPKRPYAEGSGWAFDFPRAANCSVKKGCPGVHYVTTKYTEPIPTHSILTLSFKSRSGQQHCVQLQVGEGQYLRWASRLRACPSSARRRRSLRSKQSLLVESGLCRPRPGRVHDDG